MFVYVQYVVLSQGCMKVNRVSIDRLDLTINKLQRAENPSLDLVMLLFCAFYVELIQLYKG